MFVIILIDVIFIYDYHICGILTYKNGDMTYVNSSQAALMPLWSKSRSSVVPQYMDKLKQLVSTKVVKLKCDLGHKGAKGNERTDELAKKLEKLKLIFNMFYYAIQEFWKFTTIWWKNMGLTVVSISLIIKHSSSIEIIKF